MESQNVPGTQPEAPKKSKKKLIIGAIIGSLLIVGIALGATTNFMGKFTGVIPGTNPDPGDTEETREVGTRDSEDSDDTTIVFDTNIKTTFDTITYDFAVQNYKQLDDEQIQVTICNNSDEGSTIEDGSILMYYGMNDTYINETAASTPTKSGACTELTQTIDSNFGKLDPDTSYDLRISVSSSEKDEDEEYKNDNILEVTFKTGHWKETTPLGNETAAENSTNSASAHNYDLEVSDASFSDSERIVVQICNNSETGSSIESGVIYIKYAMNDEEVETTPSIPREGECSYTNYPIASYFGELEDDTSYEMTVTIDSTEVLDEADETNNTTSTDYEVESSTLNTNNKTGDTQGYYDGTGLSSFLDKIDMDNSDEVDTSIKAQGVITDLDLSASVTSSDDIYISDVSVHEDYTHVYVTVGTTETEVDDLLIGVTLEGNNNTDPKYFYADIASGAYHELSIDIDDFQDVSVVSGETYTITATVYPDDAQDEHNDKSYNDEVSTSFSLPIDIEVTDIMTFDTDEKTNTTNNLDSSEVADIDNDSDTHLKTDSYSAGTYTATDLKDLYIEDLGLNDSQNRFYVEVCADGTSGDESIKIQFSSNNRNDLKGVSAPEDGECKTSYSSEIEDQFSIAEDSEETLTVTIDTHNYVDETDEDNNEESTTFTIESTGNITSAEKFTPETIVESIQSMMDNSAGYTRSTDDISTAEELGAEYGDVKKSDWFAEDVGRITELGIMQGYSDGRFGAADSITREQLAKVVLETFEYPIIDDYVVTEWTDVSEGEWYSSYVYSAEYYGIMVGYGDTFGLGMEVNRAEALKVVLEASMIANMPSSELYIGSEDVWVNPFTDVRSYDWFYEYVMQAYYGEIITANSNEFRGAEYLNRAEIVTIMMNIIDLLSTATI